MASAHWATNEIGMLGDLRLEIADGRGAAEGRGEGAHDRYADLHGGEKPVGIVF